MNKLFQLPFIKETASWEGILSSSYDGHDDDIAVELLEEVTSDSYTASRINGSDGKETKTVPRQVPSWLAYSTPNEFLEAMKKSDSPLRVKYLQTMVECLSMLGKVAVAGAMTCQRLRPTIHDIITAKIKAHAILMNSSRPGIGKAARTTSPGLHYLTGQLQSYQLPKQKCPNGILFARTLLAVSPVSPVMASTGPAQAAAKELLDSILETVLQILENHVIVGDLLKSKSTQPSDLSATKSMNGDINVNLDTDISQLTGCYSVGFSLTVLQSECQQLICAILRATQEAASADAVVQTTIFASKAPSKEKRP